MSFELLVAGVVLIAGGILQIRVQRWSKGPSSASGREDASPSEGDGRGGADEDAGRSRRLWVAWTEVLGIVSIVFGVVVLVVALTR